MPEIKSIFTPNAPIPAGHYAQATIHHNVIYISGQLPIDANGVKMTNATVAQQTEQVLRNISAILAAAGSSLNHVLQMTIYITDIEHWGEVNQVYAQILGDHKPARAVVPVKELHYGLAIEIQATAAL